jgi:hypothetical protein
MADVTREQLHAFLDDALTDAEASRVEQALRASEPLRRALKQIMQERDRGEHSLGAVWRRERLTCPTREDLNSFLLEVHDHALQDYSALHIRDVGCPYCTANLADLRARQQEDAGQAKERRKRFFVTSAAYLQAARDPKAK